MKIDADEIADTEAIKALSEIQSIICDDENTDFDAVERIVNIFERYKLDTGGRHDY